MYFNNIHTFNDIKRDFITNFKNKDITSLRVCTEDDETIFLYHYDSDFYCIDDEDEYKRYKNAYFDVIQTSIIKLYEEDESTIEEYFLTITIRLGKIKSRNTGINLPLLSSIKTFKDINKWMKDNFQNGMVRIMDYKTHTNITNTIFEDTLTIEKSNGDAKLIRKNCPISDAKFDLMGVILYEKQNEAVFYVIIK